MNETEIAEGKQKLVEMNEQDKQYRLRLEELDIEIAPIQGQLAALQEDYNRRSRALNEEASSLGRERQLLLERRKADKFAYGILFEQVGRAERAMEAEKATETETKPETE